MAELTELRSTTLADGVEDSLLDYIRRSRLEPGDLLPKEEELSRKLNVSRHIVREGVSRLKTLGLIESRKHKGMILTRPNVFAGVSKLAEARLFSENECREFMQMRAYMELGMTESIFRKKTSDNGGRDRIPQQTGIHRRERHRRGIPEDPDDGIHVYF